MTFPGNLYLVPMVAVGALYFGAVVADAKFALVDWLVKRDTRRIELPKFTEEEINSVFAAVDRVSAIRNRKL